MQKQLLQCIEKGDGEQLITLIEDGINANTMIWCSFYEDIKIKVRLPLLHIASSKGKYFVAMKLIEYGANVNGVDRYETTAMHWAATSGQVKIVKLLLQHKANINARDICSMTPLHSAAHSGRPKTIKYLLKMGANLSIKSIHNESALDFAKNEKNSKCIKLLKEAQSIQYPFANEPIIRSHQLDECKSNTLNRNLSIYDDEMSVISMLSPRFVNNDDEKRQDGLVASSYNINADKSRKSLINKVQNLQTTNKKSTKCTKKRRRHLSFDDYLDTFSNVKHDELVHRFEMLQNMKSAAQSSSRSRRHSQIGL